MVFTGQARILHGQERPATHGIDVTQGVGGSDLAKAEGVVDNGGEKIQGLDQGRLIIEPIDSGIIAGFCADNQIRIFRQGNSTQYLTQVPRAKLGRSTGSLYSTCQLYHYSSSLILHILQHGLSRTVQ